MRKIFLLCLISFLCPLLMAEEAPVPSSEDTDRIINEAITPEKPVEKQQSYGYKKAKIKKIKKGKKLPKVNKVKKTKKAKTNKKKTKKVRGQNEKAQSGM